MNAVAPQALNLPNISTTFSFFLQKLTNSNFINRQLYGLLQQTFSSTFLLIEQLFKSLCKSFDKNIVEMAALPIRCRHQSRCSALLRKFSMQKQFLIRDI